MDSQEVRSTLSGRVYASIDVSNSGRAHNADRLMVDASDPDAIHLHIADFLYLSVERQDWPRIVAAVEEAIGKAPVGLAETWEAHTS